MKALIAMSGGVDSSVAAYLTQKAGFECIGCTMKLHDDPGDMVVEKNTCCTLDAIEDARSVAFRLGMEYHVFNFKEGFREKVIDRFVFCYENGLTPNPCIDCNRFMKFDKLFERAKILGCDKIVTGHYARVGSRDGRNVLLKAKDPSKDQSYVLYSLTQEQLSHVLFPLGEMSKNETRSIAEEQGFINYSKPDSQDICFVPRGKYYDVIRNLTGKEYPEGDFVYKDGTVLGRHKGIICYTRGQRKGLGIASEEPLYVLSTDPVNNTVILGTSTGAAESPPRGPLPVRQRSDTGNRSSPAGRRYGRTATWKSYSTLHKGRSLPVRPAFSTTGMRSWAAELSFNEKRDPFQDPVTSYFFTPSIHNL